MKIFSLAPPEEPVRTQRSPKASTSRRVLTATALSAAIGGASLLMGGTATASTVLPENPEQNCSTNVHGVIGDTVAVTGTSVKELVRKGAQEAKEIPLIDDLAIWPNHLARAIADEGAIPVGTVPDAASGKVEGDAVGKAVIERIKNEPGLGLDPQQTLGVIENKLAENCGLTVFTSNYSEPSNPNGDQGPGGAPAGTPSSTPGAAAGGTRYGTGDARAPRRDYSGIPAVPAPQAGIAVPPDLRYPPAAALPQQVPDFSVLGGSQNPGGQPPGQHPDVRNAGNAEQLAAPAPPDHVQLPMLVAVVALAGVTAALVRTWVLRRS